ncbi:MAG: hypothetical protein ACYSU1_05190, partial [Planctomycetota bacterium]
SCSQGQGSDAPSDPRTAEEWLDTARAQVSRPRTTSFSLETGSAEAQQGEIRYFDAHRFAVTSRTSVTRTRPDGPPESSEITMRTVADGEQLRILLPATFGGNATMAVLPVDRIPELASATTPFRLELLQPLEFANSLLLRFQAERFEETQDASGNPRILLHGRMPAGTLADLGLGGTDAVDSGARAEALLDAQHGVVLSLSLFPSAPGEHGLHLVLPDTAAPAEDAERHLRLALPEGASTMDLSRLLPTGGS